MNDKEFKRHVAYEVLVILGVLSLLLFICRLWPILLLVILGIFYSALRLLFFSVKKVEVIEPAALPEMSEPTEQDIRNMAYGAMQKRITELVCIDYPTARWLWETPNAKASIDEGKEVYILLNRAGGYRRAKVIVQDLCVRALAYSENDVDADEQEPDEDVDELECAEEVETVLPKPEKNYEYLAFEWVDVHAVLLNERCNEAIAQGQSVLLLEEDILLEREGWEALCRELDRNGIENCEITQDGIVVHLTQ